MSKAILLFSGGLDSILAAKILQKQNVEVLCVHFTSPFFGDKTKINRWRYLYHLDIIEKNISNEFTQMLLDGPEHGYGKNMNPCVDCKILLCRLARKIMEENRADFLASGEVIGQRPMSQRRDTLHLIQNKANVAGLLLRPLSALLLEETIPEKQGLVDRSLLEKISGRGRNRQLELAEIFGIQEIPSPAGGCRLTEKENTRRYWKLLKTSSSRKLEELAEDFNLAGLGRLLFHLENNKWIVMGRNKAENARIFNSKTAADSLIKLSGFPGPLGLARNGSSWPDEICLSACEMLASYAPQAVNSASPVDVICYDGKKSKSYNVTPNRHENLWTVPDWEQTHEELKLYRKNELEKKTNHQK